MALFVVICVVATYMFSKKLTPIYESTAVLDVDWQAPSGVIGQDAARNGSPVDAEQFLATQMRLVQSDIVLRPVAEKYQLLSAEHQIQPGGNTRNERVSQAPINLANLTVSRPANTYLMTVSYRSEDPQLSANVANGIARSYLETAFMLRVRSSSEMARFMERQLGEVKTKMDESSRALAPLENDLNVVNPEDKANILSARLLQLNGEYTAALADRINKEAAWKRNGPVAPGLAEPLNQAIQRLDDVRRRFAVVTSTYGWNHPEYMKAESELTEVQGQYAASEKRVADLVQADYERAQTREEMLRNSVAETKAEYDQLSARFHQYQERKREADADKRVYEELSNRIKEAGINSGFQSNAIRTADPARPSSIPIWPKVRLNTVLAFLFSGVAAMFVVFVSDARDTLGSYAVKLQRYSGVDVIGALPAVSRLTDDNMLGVLQPRLALDGKPTFRKRLDKGKRGSQSAPYSTLGVYAEAIRTLRNTIVLSDFDRRLRTILVTSATSGEGKTTTAVNLAIAHAAQNSKTLVIDADLRRPSVHQRFGIPDGAGLFEVLTRNVPWRDVVRGISGIPDLHVIAAGQPSFRASDLIGPRMGSLLQELAGEFDLVVIDAPSLRGFADPLQIASLADGVLIISEVGGLRLDAVNQVVRMLARVRANVIGIVLNRVRPDASSGSENYASYSHAKTV